MSSVGTDPWEAILNEKSGPADPWEAILNEKSGPADPWEAILNEKSGPADPWEAILNEKSGPADPWESILAEPSGEPTPIPEAPRDPYSDNYRDDGSTGNTDPGSGLEPPSDLARAAFQTDPSFRFQTDAPKAQPIPDSRSITEQASDAKGLNAMEREFLAIGEAAGQGWDAAKKRFREIAAGPDAFGATWDDPDAGQRARADTQAGAMEQVGPVGGFAAGMTGGLAGVADPAQAATLALGGVAGKAVGAMAGKGMAALAPQLSKAIGADAAQVVTKAITTGTHGLGFGATAAGINEASAISPEEWAADPVAALTRVGKAMGGEGALWGAIGAITGGLGAIRPILRDRAVATGRAAMSDAKQAVVSGRKQGIQEPPRVQENVPPVEAPPLREEGPSQGKDPWVEILEETRPVQPVQGEVLAEANKAAPVEPKAVEPPVAEPVSEWALTKEPTRAEVPARGDATRSNTIQEPLPPSRHLVQPTQEGVAAERQTVENYLAKHDASKGQVPAREPYLPTRDETFAAGMGGHTDPVPEFHGQPSQIYGGIESAQDAIRIGERLGYRPEDIAAYLHRNYTPEGIAKRDAKMRPSAPDPVEAKQPPPLKMKLADLRRELTEGGVEFDPKASKRELASGVEQLRALRGQSPPTVAESKSSGPSPSETKSAALAATEGGSGPVVPESPSPKPRGIARATPGEKSAFAPQDKPARSSPDVVSSPDSTHPIDRAINTAAAGKGAVSLKRIVADTGEPAPRVVERMAAMVADGKLDINRLAATARASVERYAKPMQTGGSLTEAPDTSKYPDTPWGRQYAGFKKAHPDAILLMRIGDFYEAFGKDAERLHKSVGLTLTRRGETPMAGLPHHQLESYLKKIIANGDRVAISEQVQPAANVPVTRTEPKEAKPKRVTAADVKRAERDYASASQQYGENNAATIRALGKWQEAKKAYGESRPRKGENIIIPKVVEEAAGLASRGAHGAKNIAEGAVSFLRRLSDTASGYMERLGPAGKKLAGEVRDIDRTGHKESATDRLALRDVLAGMDRKARETVAKAINGRIGELHQPASLRAKAAQVREILDRAMKAANAAGLKRTVAGHEVDIKGSGKAFPQVPNEAGRIVLDEAETKGLSSPRVQRTIEKMHRARRERAGLDPETPPTPDETNHILASLKKLRDQQKRGVNPYFERTRIELPEDLVEWDPARVLPHLLDRNWMLVQAVEKWGPDFKGRDAGLQTIAYEHGQHHATTIDNYLKASFGLTGQVDPAIDKAIRAASNYESLSKMGFSPLSVFRNVGGRFSNLFGYDPSIQLKALKDLPPFVGGLFRESRKIGEAMEKTGAVRATSTLADIEVGAPGHGITNKALGLFKVAERGNQVHTSYIAGLQLAADIDRLAKAQPRGPLGKIMESLVSLTGLRDTDAGVARRVERAGIDGDQLADIMADPKHRLTPEQVERAAYLAVNDTQFALSLATSPVWWANSPALRLMAKFKPWGVRQVQLIYNQVAKEAIKGNGAPLARFVVAVTLAGELYYEARDLIVGSDKSIASAALSGEDDPKEYAWRVLRSFLAGGGLGFISDLTYGVSAWVGGPAVNTAKSGMEAIASIAQRPTLLQSQAAIRKFLRDEFAVSRQALPIIDRIDKWAFNEGNVAAEYGNLRAKGFAFREGKTAGVGSMVKDVLVGKEFGIGKNTIPYDYAARNITVNDIDDAADYLASVLSDAPDRKAAVQGIRASLRSHSPLGPVAEKDRGKFLQSLSAEDRAAALKLNSEWIRRSNQALAEAIRKARPSSGSGEPQ